MLYISRAVTDETFGVVDTDDDTEEVVTTDDIAYAATFGIKIEGVFSAEELGHDGLPYTEVMYIYQPEGTLSHTQKKLLALYGVDIKVYKGSIVAVSWNAEAVPPNTSVRLSQVAPKLGDFAFFITSNETPEELVTMILDDKLDIAPNALWYAFGSCMVFDIREVTRPELLDLVYQAYFDQGGDDEYPGELIDSKARFKKYKKKYGR